MTKLSSVTAAVAASLFLAVLANPAAAMSNKQNKIQVKIEQSMEFSARRHKHRVRHHHVRRIAPDYRAALPMMNETMTPQERSDYYARGGDESYASAPARRSVRSGRQGDIAGGFTANALVSEARKYIGTNPTGRGSLWCGAFMDLVLKRTGHPGGGNLASSYAHYGTRVSGPQVGAIAVMGRRGGGHVGVVSGIDPNGNPIIISGNTRMGGGPHSTLEHAYPRSRIYAYRMP